MRILGIDPGTRRMGYGIAEEDRGSYWCIAVGCFTTPTLAAPSARLFALQEHLHALLLEHRPSGAAIERLFFSKNTRTALAIAEARGMILTTLAQAHVPIVELSPQHVKLGVTGYGKATKRQVQHMVQRLFTLPRPPSPDDAADALALAFTGLSHFRQP
jgi:crossover junction endodeoxyribonuclease RuvC